MSKSKRSIEEKYNSPFAKAVRELMREQSATQDVLAEKIGKTRQTVSQYVNGISEPGYDTLVKMADHFGVSTDYLLGRSVPKTVEASAQAAIEYTGLSEENINSLHFLVANKETSLEIDRSDHMAYIDGCKLILDCFNDLFDALMGDRETAERIARYYLRIRQNSGHLGEYKNDDTYIGTTKDVFPGIHKEREHNIIVEHSCVKMGREIEKKLKMKYMGYYLEEPEE